MALKSMASGRNPRAEKGEEQKKSNLGREIGDTERWLYGLVLLFLSLFVLISVVSYYFSWSDDQSMIRLGWSAVGEVGNVAGKLGAFIGATLVGRWFGALALCIPIVLIILSLRIMRVRPLFLNRSVRITFIIMILGSVSLGYLFGTRWGVFGTGIGGEAGIAAAAWFVSLLGKAGFGLLLIMGWILLAVYVNRNTIKVINRVGDSVSKSAWGLFSRNRKDKTSDPDRKEITVGDVAVTQVNVAKADEDEDFLTVANTYFEPVVEDESLASKDSAEKTDEVGYVKADPLDLPQDEDVFIRREEEFPDEIVNRDFENNEELYVEDDDFMVLNPIGEKVKASTLRENGDMPATSQSHVQIGAGGVVSSDEDGIQVLQSEYKEEEEDDITARLYDPTLELKDYKRPSVDDLIEHSTGIKISDEEIKANQEIIREKLADFGIKINERIKSTVGPTVTLYEIEPAQGVKISRIRNLEEDIALALKVQSIRIMTLGAGHGTVGIEVPNSTREVVSMKSIIKSAKFQNNEYKLPIALGKTIYNEVYIGDLAKMPHLLVAGATGQGKSVGLNAIITSLLYKKHPAELKFVMVDPKQVELSVYAKLEKHFLAKMESEESAILTDTQKVVYTLNSLVNIMEERYTLLNKAGERNIADYNQKFLNRRLNPEKGHQFLPYIVVIIDEFADMIMTAGKEVEIPITRLAAKARAVGIHLIVATQRPDVKVITGLIKSNIPARIAFKVVSMVDSRTIIDQPGANNLIGMGDMLMSINGDLTRIQCAFIDTPEIERITNHISSQKGYVEAYPLPDYSPTEVNGGGGSSAKEDFGKTDEMFAEIARWVVDNKQGSTSAIQRTFELGYNRAGRITDQLFKAGIVGPPNGSKPREVLIYDMATLESILIDLDL